MISRLKGTLLSRALDRVEIETAGGVVYEVEVPLSVLQRLPSPPKEGVELRTLQLFREDSATLYGFMEVMERELFRRLMSVSGVGAKLALAMLSTYSAHRLARALVERDVTALRQVSGVGKKTAERIALELADKVTDLAMAEEGSTNVLVGQMSREAVGALISLGYSFTDADQAVRLAIEEADVRSADELIRSALQQRGT